MPNTSGDELGSPQLDLRLPRWSLAAPQGVIGVTIAQAFTLPVIFEKIDLVDHGKYF
jgi:uncharacterized membrane protein AbrB (regulator of aidB expression)